MPTMFKFLISVLPLFIFLFPLRFVAKFVYLNGRPKEVFSIDIFILGDHGFDAKYGSVIDFYRKYIPQLFNKNLKLGDISTTNFCCKNIFKHKKSI